MHIGEVWSDVPPLPDVRPGSGDLYVRFPTLSSAERTRRHLAGANFEVWSYPDNPLLIAMPGVDALTALHCLVDVSTPPERADTLAVLRPSGAGFDSIDKLSALSIEHLCNRLSANWLIDLLRRQKVSSVFQPIVAAGDTKTVYGYEVLLRARHDGEVVNTSRMLAIAESAHIMAQVDALGMQTAFATAANAKLKGMLFVNCSPAHMYDPYTRVTEAASYCRRLGLEPQQVVLEVVETEKNDREHLRAFMLACRKHGFLVALDDLGSGYSSLTVLTELHPNILKFDRDLVHAIDTDAYRALIVNRLTEASRVLGLATVVEGVETQAELTWAASNGATYVQGNFIGKPSPLD